MGRNTTRFKPRQPGNRKAELAQIHMGAQALGLIDGNDDSAYRQMLHTVARVDSAAKLDEAGRRRVIDHLKARGWTNKPRVRPIRRPADLNAADQVKLIYHLWACLHTAGVVRDGSEKALRAYTRKQTQAAARAIGVPGWDAPELLPTDVAQNFIEQLKRWAARMKVEWR